MRRKIIRHGPISLIITLPSAWTKENNLKRGDELDLIPDGNGLLIKPVQKSNTVRKTEISFAEIDKSIREDLLRALHKKGFDEIKINFETPNTVKEVYALLNEMNIGFEIIKQNPNDVVIRNISNPETDQLDNLVRRSFRITIEYIKKLQAVLENKEEITESCLLHESSIKRVSNYCKRIIAKDKIQNACFLYAIIENLEMIAQNITMFVGDTREMNEAIPSELVSAHQKLIELLIQTYSLHYKFSLEGYSSLISASKNLGREIHKFNKASDFRNQGCLEVTHNRINSLLESILAIHI